MKKILSFIISISLTVGYFGQYCSTGGPTSTFDSNVESVSLLGENTTSINYIGCPGVSGVENQTTLTVDLVSDVPNYLDAFPDADKSVDADYSELVLQDYPGKGTIEN